MPAAAVKGRVDLDNQIDMADVDAELQRRRGNQAAKLAGLEQALDLEPLLAGNAAVVALCDLMTDMVIEPQGQAFAKPAAICEDKHRAAAFHELQQVFDKRRPYRLLISPSPRRFRHRHPKCILLLGFALDNSYMPRLVSFPAAKIPSYPLDRLLRG